MAGAEQATLAELEKLNADPDTSGLAAIALELARGLDCRNSLTSKAMAAKAHADIMDRLRELSPPVEERDGVDDLSAARERRAVARRAAAKD